jgi:DNA-binding MarR family transcriptional regulator
VSYYDIVTRHGSTSLGPDDKPQLPKTEELGDRDFQQLLDLRTRLRRFLHWSDLQAQAVGLTSAHHQLLLAVRGLPDPQGPTVGEAARYLMLRPHSAVGLIDRAAAAGLVERVPDPDRHGTVHVQLTPTGEARLHELTALHLEELRRLAPSMETLLRGIRADEGGNP